MTDVKLQPFAPARPQDDEALTRFNSLVRAACGMREPVEPRPLDDEWQSFGIYNKSSTPYAAMIDDDPAAVAARLKFVKFGRVLEIAALGVALNMRREGLGTTALSEIVAMGKEEGMRVIKVTALTRAQYLYERHGFEVTGTVSGLTQMHLQLSRY